MILRAAREKSDKTQKQVSQESGVTEVSYQRIEYGSQRPSLTTAILIARSVNSTVEELFGAATPEVNQPSNYELEYLKQRKEKLKDWKIP